MAIDDPKQRIKYLRSMAGHARGEGTTDFNLALGNIRSDLALIENEEIQKVAEAMFQKQLGIANYALERNPEKYHAEMKKLFEGLADYLKKSDS